MSDEKKWTIVERKPIRKGGKRYGTKALCSDGEVRTFLNPHGKGKKYAYELKNNERITNGGYSKKTATGATMHLSGKGRAYRAGYLQAQQDSAATYNLKNGNPVKKRERKK